MTPKNAQVLLREYVDEANDLARTPRLDPKEIVKPYVAVDGANLATR